MELSGRRVDKSHRPRAFRHNTEEILILDEPTAALDARSESQCSQTLHRAGAREDDLPDFAPLLHSSYGRSHSR